MLVWFRGVVQSRRMIIAMFLFSLLRRRSSIQGGLFIGVLCSFLAINPFCKMRDFEKLKHGFIVLTQIWLQRL